MEYYSAIKKNAFESVLRRWMKLKPIIQSEVSQKGKHPINAYIWNLERRYQWPYMWDSKRDTYIKNRLLDSVREGEGGMIWENNIEICILHLWNRWPVQVWCMKQGIQSWCTGTTQRNGVGKEMGWGTHAHPRLIHVNEWQKPPQYCKVIILQLK